MNALSVAQLRQIDSIATLEFGISNLVLMENAGRGAADRLVSLASSLGNPQTAHTVILCGTGNNGGDGLVIARHLHGLSHPVSVWMFGSPEKLAPCTEINYRILTKTRVPCIWISDAIHPQHCDTDQADSVQSRYDLRSSLQSASVLVDAMLGTGAHGEPRGCMAHAIRIANDASATRVAIDVPTGLDADTGAMAATTWLAHHTLTLVAPKICFALAHVQRCLGWVTVLPIGIPPEVLARV